MLTLSLCDGVEKCPGCSSALSQGQLWLAAPAEIFKMKYWPGAQQNAPGLWAVVCGPWSVSRGLWTSGLKSAQWFFSSQNLNFTNFPWLLLLLLHSRHRGAQTVPWVISHPIFYFIFHYDPTETHKTRRTTTKLSKLYLSKRKHGCSKQARLSLTRFKSFCHKVQLAFVFTRSNLYCSIKLYLFPLFQVFHSESVPRRAGRVGCRDSVWSACGH